MSARYTKSYRRNRTCDVNIDTLIERLKKVRALNCSPSDVGMDSFVWKKLLFNKLSNVTKFL